MKRSGSNQLEDLLAPRSQEQALSVTRPQPRGRRPGGETWARLPASIRPSLTATLLQDLVKDAGGALSAGTFDARPDSHLTWTPMILDEEGWQEASGSLRELLERILEIQALSAERLTKAGEAGFRVSVAAMAYETPTSGDHRPNPLPDPS